MPVIGAPLRPGKCEWDMSNTYIIEVGSESAGIVVRDRAGFRFFSASPRFSSLEGKLFRSARDAERAAKKRALSPKAAYPRLVKSLRRALPRLKF
ncbi:MAG: hypothetical protein NTAFB05_19430 [Nitrobacter sp.]